MTHQVQASMDFQVDPLTQVQTPLKTLGLQSTAQRLIPSLSRTSKYAAYQNLLIEEKQKGEENFPCVRITK